MSRTRARRRRRRAISRQGQPVELVLYEVIDRGTRGEEASELTRIDTRAILDTGGGTFQTERELVFTDVETDVLVFLRDDVTEDHRAENNEGELVRPVISSVDTVIQNAATKLIPKNTGPMNRDRVFRFNQAHDWSDAGIIVASAVEETA
jgi:hypothetical protein